MVTTGKLWDQEAYSIHENESNILEIQWHQDRLISDLGSIHVLASNQKLSWWVYTLFAVTDNAVLAKVKLPNVTNRSELLCWVVEQG